MMHKYIVRSSNHNETTVYSVYETDGDVEVAVYESLDPRKAHKYKDDCNALVARNS